MPLSINVTARKLLKFSELLTSAKFNLCNWITIALTGTASTSQIADGAVTPAKSSFGAWFWGGVAGGTANAQTVTVTPAITSYATGLVLAYVALSANTGAVTVAVSALAAKTIKLPNGQDLSGGDVRAGQVLELRYDGTNFILMSPVADVDDRFVTSTGSANAYVAAYGGTTGWPTIAALKTGVRAWFKASFANTGAATLNADGLGAKALRKGGDVAMGEGDIAVGQIVGLEYDEAANGAAGAWLMLTPVSTGTVAVVNGQTSNLIIKPNAGAASSKVDVSADAVVLKTSSGLSYLAETVAVTIDLAGGNGANKLDAGAEANGTWYYLWIISDGATVAGLISASATAPTLPAGYTYKALVGVFRNSGTAVEGAAAGDIVPFYQIGKRVYVNDLNILANYTPASNINYQAMSAASVVALNTMLPPNAKRTFGTCGSDVTDAVGQIGFAGDSSGLGAVNFCFAPTGGAALDSFFAAAPFEVPLKTAQEFYFRGRNATYKARVNLGGYDL